MAVCFGRTPNPSLNVAAYPLFFHKKEAAVPAASFVHCPRRSLL